MCYLYKIIKLDGKSKKIDYDDNHILSFLNGDLTPSVTGIPDYKTTDVMQKKVALSYNFEKLVAKLIILLRVFRKQFYSGKGT